MFKQSILWNGSFHEAINFIAGERNTQELIDIALREFVRGKKSNPLAEAFGQYPWDGDLETMRCDNVVGR